MLIYLTQVTGHRVCMCVLVVGRWSRDGGRARKESSSWLACLGCQALYCCPAPTVQPLLPLCSNVLDLALQGPIIEGAVSGSWPVLCYAKSQARCKLPAAFPMLNQGRHRPCHPSALSIPQHSQRCEHNNALVELLPVLRGNGAE